MDPYPSPSRSRSYSLNLAFDIFLLLLPSISASFFGDCSSSSYSLPLPSCRSRFSPSFSLSRPAPGRPRPAHIPTVVGSSLYGCLFLPARAMPCSDCLTPTLHVRTTERPPRSLFTGSAHDQPFPSFSLVPLRETARWRCTLCQGLSRSLSYLHLPLPTSYPILRSRPDQPFLSEIFRRPRACTSLHLTSWSSPRPRKCAGQSRAHVRHFHSYHSSRIRLGRDGRDGRSLYHTHEQAGSSRKGVLLPFSSLTIGFACDDDRTEKEISIE